MIFRLFDGKNTLPDELFRFYGCKNDAHPRDFVSMAVKMTHPAQPGLVSVIVKHRVKKSPVGC